MKTTIDLDGIGIGERLVEGSATATKAGILVRAYLPGLTFDDLLGGDVLEQLIGWDEYETENPKTNHDNYLQIVCLSLARRLVKNNEHTRRPGELVVTGNW